MVWEDRCEKCHECSTAWEVLIDSWQGTSPEQWERGHVIWAQVLLPVGLCTGGVLLAIWGLPPCIWAYLCVWPMTFVPWSSVLGCVALPFWIVLVSGQLVGWVMAYCYNLGHVSISFTYLTHYPYMLKPPWLIVTQTHDSSLTDRLSWSRHFGSWDLYHHSMSSYLDLFMCSLCSASVRASPPVVLSMITHCLTCFDCVYLCPNLCTDLCLVLVYKPCVHIVWSQTWLHL